MKLRYLLLFLLLTGCQQKPDHPEGKSGDAPATKVKKVTPLRKALQRTVEQPGTIQAYEETPLYARLAGFVDKKIHKLIGDEVKQGDVLAEIAIPELVEEANQKKALVDQAKVEVEQAQKNLLTAGANVAAAEALVKVAKAAKNRAQANHDRWKSESERITKLAADKVIDTQTRDETLNQFRSAEAARDETVEQIASAVATAAKSEAEKNRAVVDVRLAQARQQVSEAEARRLGELVKYTKIRAPFDGVVTRRNVDPGHFVQPADSGKAEPLFTVARVEPVLIAISVPEADAALVRKGQKVDVVVQVLGGRVFSGKVSRTSWALEPGSRTLRTEIDLENAIDSDTKERPLRPGLYAYARITTALPAAWVLPVSAVVKQGEQLVCFRIDGGKAVRLPVQVGHTDGDWVQVIRKQRTASPMTWEEFTGMEVIARKGKGLTDGQTVTVEGP